MFFKQFKSKGKEVDSMVLLNTNMKINGKVLYMFLSCILHEFSLVIGCSLMLLACTILRLWMHLDVVCLKVFLMRLMLFIYLNACSVLSSVWPTNGTKTMD